MKFGYPTKTQSEVSLFSNLVNWDIVEEEFLKQGIAIIENLK